MRDSEIAARAAAPRADPRVEPVALDDVADFDHLDDFDTFVQQRGDALWRAAWLLTGDDHLAEDLVQTALAKCWSRWTRLGDAGAFEAYVRRVLFTTYAAWWRRRWNGERPTEHLPDRPARTEARDGGLAHDTAVRHDLAAALRTLPRGQRAVAVLRWFEDLTERQTAEVLGISVGTVKSQASRALATLRHELNGERP